LTRVATLFQAGQYAEAQDALDQRTGNPATQAPPAIELWRGRLHKKAGRYSEAQVALEASYHGADRTSNDIVRAHASLELADLFTHRRQNLEASQRWVEFAEAVITRVGAKPSLWMQLHRARGGLRHAQGQLPDARREFEHVLALAEELDDTQGFVVADAHNDLANVLYADGVYDQAKRHYTAALTLYTTRLGEAHPELGKPHNNLSGLLHDMGEHQQAITHGRAALAIYTKALGPEHPRVGLTLSNLGRAYLAADRRTDARNSFERAIKILESAHSKQHATVAYPLSNLANLELKEGNLDSAERHHMRALEIRRAATTINDPIRAYNLTDLGMIAHANGRLQQATELLERASELRGRADVHPRDRAATQYALAKVLWDASSEKPSLRDRAHQLAQEALSGLRSDRGYSTSISIPEVTHWLAEHPR
ncbi:MAG: tetratricopeptide repeat protein, partial [Nannocystaceae bacterium]